MSKHLDHAGFVPIRFTDAMRAGELDGVHYLLGCLLATLCYECRRTSDGVAIVRLSTLIEWLSVHEVINLSDETVRRRLHDLVEQGWIECEVRRGPQAGWRIRLTGLHSPPRSPTHFLSISTEEGGAEWKCTSTGISTGELSPDDAKGHGESGSAAPGFPLEPPHDPISETDTRPDPTRPNRTTAVEEKLDTDLGEVTGEPDRRAIRPLITEDGYVGMLEAAVLAGAITQQEALQQYELHKALGGGVT